MPNDRIDPNAVGNQTGFANIHGVVQGIAEGDEGRKNGVYGSSVHAHGVKAISIKNDGLSAESTEGVGIVAKGGRGAAELNGTVTIKGKADVRGEMHVSEDAFVAKNINVGGNISVKGDITLENEDFAEDFDVAETDTVAAGMVMVLDDNGALRKCATPMDKRVAGVVSGAGIYKPGIILGRKDSSSKRVPIAMLGKVCCSVDATYGAIQVGDLLTTSCTPGAAMRVANPAEAIGAIIGKALKPWNAGIGEIPILIALQ